jgi:hypothetical protein
VRLISFCIALISFQAFSWGFDGHRRLASMMHEQLPSNLCLKNWIVSKQNTTNQNMACDPDRWRIASDPNYDMNEAPRHYLEIDYLNPIQSYPRDFNVVVSMLGNRVATQNGIVPWRSEEMFQQLVADFASKDETRIVKTLFTFTHYIADSFSVLHNTKNFDPNNGLHSRWESDMLNPIANINAITTDARTYYGTAGRADVKNNIFEVVIAGNPLVPQLINFDLDAGSTNIQKLFINSRTLTAKRWGDAVTLLSSIVWTAWAQAGSPELSGFNASCSRAVPTNRIVAVGYPPAAGFTLPTTPFPDAGIFDAGTLFDAGTPDAAIADAAGFDASVPDAGVPDAAADFDGGATDAGQLDSGIDAGVSGGGTAGGFVNPFFGGGTGGGGNTNPPPQGCSCNTSLLTAALFGFVWRRRRVASNEQ